jgi:hypothetical protein
MMTDTTYSGNPTGYRGGKFGLARSHLRVKDDQYNKSIDNGFFAFVYTCDRYQADIIERIMMIYGVLKPLF